MFQLFKRNKSVPAFNQYYPTLEGANSEQREYYKWFKKQLKKGNSPIIQGNLSYVFIFLYETINNFIKDRDYHKLSFNFNLIDPYVQEYEKLNDYVHVWRSDAALLVENWREAWEYRRKRKMDTTVAYQCITNIPSLRIYAQDLYSFLGNNTGLTKLGYENRERVNTIADDIINELYIKENKNFLKAYLDKYNWENLSEGEVLEICDDCEYLFSIRKFKNAWIKAHEKEQLSTYTLFLGLVTEMEQRRENSFTDGVKYEMDISVRADKPEKNLIAVNPVINLVLIAKSRLILRESENLLREKQGLPRIGEGWISETKLFQEIKDKFDETVVIQHARPEWLKPQHFDVYLPHYNIAIEYQGAQHLQPVDYFGGEKAYKNQIQRDKRKKNLCKENDCMLIEVFQGYDPKEILEEI